MITVFPPPGNRFLLKGMWMWSKKSSSIVTNRKKALTEWVEFSYSCSALIYMGKFTYAPSQFSVQFSVVMTAQAWSMTQHTYSSNVDRKRWICETRRRMFDSDFQKFRLRVPHLVRSVVCCYSMSSVDIYGRVKSFMFSESGKLLTNKLTRKLKLIKSIVQFSIKSNQN